MKKTYLILVSIIAFCAIFSGCRKDDYYDDYGYDDYQEAPIYPDAYFTFTTSGNYAYFTNLSDNAVSYRWDFGDGYTSTSTNPSNYYINTGSYRVTLTATSSTGHTDTYSRTVTISSGGNGGGGNGSYGSVRITKLRLNQFPATPSNGGNWDFLDGEADVFFKITSNDETQTYFTSAVEESLSNSDLPVNYTVNYTLTNLNRTYKFKFYDKDGALDQNDWMGTLLWTPSSQNNNYASTYNWANNSARWDFTLYLTWYSSKGETLYESSIDIVDGHAVCKDPNVIKLLSQE